jgi:phage tail sheath protein FI
VAHCPLLRDPAERRALSYAALYHPWASCASAPATATSPHGARRPGGGLIAKRALTRGAWVAPANDPLPNVVDLTPAIDVAGTVALLEGQVNAIVREPRGVGADLGEHVER